MTPQAANVLTYLRRYLAADPSRVAELRALHLARTKRPLSSGLQSRHLNLKVSPNMDTTLVYLTYLHRERALLSVKEPGKLFAFAHPKYLRK